jgi:hypothetical protein
MPRVTVLAAAAVAAALATSGCVNSRSCTAIAAWGLKVTVVAGTDVGAAATVTATDGAFNEVLLEMDGVYYGATERTGTYDLEIAAAGYQTQRVEDIQVREDECHVVPRAVTVVLVPQ